MNIDFLCVGLTKCGTTTLDAIMRQEKQIQLPKIKEPRLFMDKQNFNKVDLNEWEHLFFPQKKGKRLRGIIDPTITVASSPKKVKEVFGKDVKIIIMLRDFAKRVYSDCKMIAKSWATSVAMNKYREKGKPFNECFSSYIRNDFSYYPIAGMLANYIKEFGAENVKYVLLEDMSADPEKTVKDIYRFIGLKKATKQNYHLHDNSGDYIARNKVGAIIDDYILDQLIYHTSKLVKHNLYEPLNSLRIFLYRFTMIRDDSKILPQDYEFLKRLLKNDVCELEKAIHIPLREKWGWI